MLIWKVVTSTIKNSYYSSRNNNFYFLFFIYLFIYLFLFFYKWEYLDLFEYITIFSGIFCLSILHKLGYYKKESHESGSRCKQEIWLFSL